eukprot:scaffold24337_cov82-Cyclotella_meneghiniana.AAC.3
MCLDTAVLPLSGEQPIMTAEGGLSTKPVGRSSNIKLIALRMKRNWMLLHAATNRKIQCGG